MWVGMIEAALRKQSGFWHEYGVAGKRVSAKPIVFSSPSREMKREKKIRDDYMRRCRQWKKWMISIDISKSRWRILISKKNGMRMYRAISECWWFFMHGTKNTWRNRSWRSAQGFVSRISAAIEKEKAMPSFATFSKIAHGLGKRLEIRFISSYQQSTSIKTPVLSIKTKRGFYVKESLMQ